MIFRSVGSTLFGFLFRKRRVEKKHPRFALWSNSIDEITSIKIKAECGLPNGSIVSIGRLNCVADYELSRFHLRKHAGLFPWDLASELAERRAGNGATDDLTSARSILGMFGVIKAERYHDCR